MSIGAGIFLITVGAILAFAIRDRGGLLDLNAAGVVIMLAGAAGIWLSFHITNRRRRTVSPAMAGSVTNETITTETRRAEPIPPEPTAPEPVGSELTAPEAIVPGFEQPVHSDLGDQSDTVTERQIDLDPAASGLHTPVPDRTAPVTLSEGAGAPGQDSHESRGSLARRLLHQLRRRH